MESEYNTKNRQRMLPMDDRTQWEDVFGVGKVYAVSTGRVRCTEWCIKLTWAILKSVCSWRKKIRFSS